MRFLLKSAFMIFVLLLIVPFFAPLLLGDKATRNEAMLPSGRDIGSAVSAARGTIDYMSGMCEERPEVCDDGAGLLGFLGRRARQGAEIVYLYLGAHFAEDERVPAPQQARKTTRPEQPAAEVTVVERMAEPAETPTDLIRTGAITPEPDIAPAPQPPAPAVQPQRISGLPENVPLPTRRPR
ncbi:DUF5330 domain-containing protein [Martelella sp. AD-3]|uniref:DUF5330 domain-containing protein n=1 Tax=Martelella sp. AD-3 TaxID=686597 RepID=UPI0004678460|nr:DUF5330 domain-containing protein [Martelella sp. AD-3]AMM85034.1 hypothetical protein AZF01_12235 [Martelella sp. AD-3]